MKIIKFICSAVSILSLAAFITGCGSGSGGSGSSSGVSETSNESTGSLTLKVTDAPVDSASHVVVEFTGVEIQSATGDRLNFDFPLPRQIDLLSLNSGGSEVILDKVSLPADRYDWIRLKVNASCDETDSYLEQNTRNSTF